MVTIRCTDWRTEAWRSVGSDCSWPGERSGSFEHSFVAGNGLKCKGGELFCFLGAKIKRIWKGAYYEGGRQRTLSRLTLRFCLLQPDECSAFAEKEQWERWFGGGGGNSWVGLGAMFILRCLWDVQVEMSSRELDLWSGTQGRGWGWELHICESSASFQGCKCVWARQPGERR